MLRWLFSGKVGGGTLAVAVLVFAMASAAGMLNSLTGDEGREAARTADATPVVAALPTATTPGEIELTDPSAGSAQSIVEHEAAAGPQAEAEPSFSPDVVATATATPVAAPASAVKRVGLQAGHWRSAELPAELASLRGSTGTSGGGVPEWQLNLDIARRVAVLLEAERIVVDVLPATVPPGYQADAFIAIHADGDATGRLSGFKLSGPRRSENVDAESALIAAITEQYGATTGMNIDTHISRNMTGYYAFSFRRFQHSVAPTTPSVILEMGFMTNASDLRLLLGQKDAVSQGIAAGVLSYLEQAR